MTEIEELTSYELNEIRERLLKRDEELSILSRSSYEAREAVTLDQSRVGRLSRMDALQMQAMETAAEQRRQLEQERIRRALSLIDTQEYGECVRCGEFVGRGRIAFDPSLITCVQCAQE